MLKVVVILLSLLAINAYGGEMHGYDYGKDLQTAPFTESDLELLKKTLLFTKADVHWLRESKKVLAPNAEDILDTWYGFVSSQPHLLVYFHAADGEPDREYLEAVRARFIQWIYDTADANYDQQWLDYQYEIAKRHHRTSKNKTDGATGPNHIPMRYIAALVYPVTATLQPFLASGGHDPETVTKMHQAWIKAVMLQTILWTYPYVTQGDF